MSLFAIVFFLGAEFFISFPEFFGVGTMTQSFVFLHTSQVAKMIVLVGWGLLCYSMGVLLEKNKFAGPMVNFKRSMRAIISGKDDTKIRLRENDYFKELASDINVLVEKYQCEKKRNSEIINKIIDEASTVKNAARSGENTDQIKNASESIMSMLNELKQSQSCSSKTDRD